MWLFCYLHCFQYILQGINEFTNSFFFWVCFFFQCIMLRTQKWPPVPIKKCLKKTVTYTIKSKTSKVISQLFYTCVCIYLFTYIESYICLCLFNRDYQSILQSETLFERTIKWAVHSGLYWRKWEYNDCQSLKARKRFKKDIHIQQSLWNKCYTRYHMFFS